MCVWHEAACPCPCLPGEFKAGGRRGLYWAVLGTVFVFVFVCVCARACVCVYARARACVGVGVGVWA